jgi:hypothetical protein
MKGSRAEKIEMRLNAVVDEPEAIEHLRIVAATGFRFLPQKFAMRKVGGQDYVYYRVPSRPGAKSRHRQAYIGKKADLIAFLTGKKKEDPRQMELIKPM